MAVKILCIGDVVGKPGRGILADHLADFVRERNVELVVCNAENAAGGSGLTPQIFDKLLRYGVDAVTMGDHIYRKKQIIPVLERSDRIVKPANLPRGSAGRSWMLVPTKSGSYQVAVVSLLGQMFMKNNDSPWAAVERIFAEIPSDIRIRVVDFHAEATSEKIAMGWRLDGRASVVFGTHTHVPTADAHIKPKGLAYITDVGMTGPYESVLGRVKERVLSFLTTGMPTTFDIALGDPRIGGLLVDVEPATGKAVAVERVEIRGRACEGPAYDSDDGWGHAKGRSKS